MANNRSEPRQVESAREEVSVLVTARTVFQKEGRVTSTWWVRSGWNEMIYDICGKCTKNDKKSEKSGNEIRKSEMVNSGVAIE